MGSHIRISLYKVWITIILSINTSCRFALEFFWHHQKMYKLSVVKKVSALLRLRQVFVETDRVRLPCLVQLLTWLRVSECRYFWNTERWQSLNWYFSTKQLYQSQKHLPKWRQHFVKRYVSKSTKFCMFGTIRFCSNCTSMWSKYLSNNAWRDFRLSMSATAMVT